MLVKIHKIYLYFILTNKTVGNIKKIKSYEKYCEL